MDAHRVWSGRISRFAIFLLLTSLLPTSQTFAQVPHLIRYQGQAVDSQGIGLEGPHTIRFQLYDALVGGNTLWGETVTDCPMTQGNFDALLGQITPLANFDWSKPVWLGVQILTTGNPDTSPPELTHRQQITSVPVALRAEGAERLTDSDKISPNNLLANGSFESWSAGTSAMPDGWTISSTAGNQVNWSQNSASVRYGVAALDLTNTDSAVARAAQEFTISSAENTGWQGKTFTLSCWVKAMVANRVKLRLYNAPSAYHSGGGGWELLTVTTTLPAGAMGLDFELFIEAGSVATATFDGAMLVEGSMPFAFSPSPQDALGSIHAVNGNVGIGTATPGTIFAVQQGSATDPVADSWTVYPSDSYHKIVLSAAAPKGYLDQIKAIPLYEWKRAPLVTDEEVQQFLGISTLSPEMLAAKKVELSLAKSKLPKFSTTRVGMLIDDAAVPSEVLVFNPDGSKAGIDLLAYIGYLHATLKEAAIHIKALEEQLNQ